MRILEGNLENRVDSVSENDDIIGLIRFWVKKGSKN